MVAQKTLNLLVVGSNPTGPIFCTLNLTPGFEPICSGLMFLIKFTITKISSPEQKGSHFLHLLGIQKTYLKKTLRKTILNRFSNRKRSPSPGLFFHVLDFKLWIRTNLGVNVLGYMCVTRFILRNRTNEFSLPPFNLFIQLKIITIFVII